ncbi:hypothetical protein [Aliiroseovarius sp.]|uniref:hypothetical protein n=1 Tax=Aliiroseovarius sp. TaxID=1872442 RepID=UPI003BACD976
MTSYVLMELQPSGNVENRGELSNGTNPAPGDLLIDNDLEGNPIYFEVVTRVFPMENGPDHGDLIIIRLDDGEGRLEHYQRRLSKLGA